VAVDLFLEWAQCCSINSAHLDTALLNDGESRQTRPTRIVRRRVVLARQSHVTATYQQVSYPAVDTTGRHRSTASYELQQQQQQPAAAAAVVDTAQYVTRFYSWSH